MANGIRTGDPRGFNKGRSSKFREGSRVRQTPEEWRRTYRPKRCGNNNKDEDNSPKNFNDKNYNVDVLREFRKRFLGKRRALLKSSQWHFQQDNTPVYNSILVTDYLTKMGIKTVPHRPYSPDLTPCDFCLFPKFRGYRFETIEEIKEAVTKVIDTLTREDFHGAFQKVLER